MAPPAATAPAPTAPAVLEAPTMPETAGKALRGAPAAMPPRLLSGIAARRPQTPGHKATADAVEPRSNKKGTAAAPAADAASATVGASTEGANTT
eukprot:1659742-Pleurochrysis_carterae.AAC.1